jgi:hypothetical protein
MKPVEEYSIQELKALGYDEMARLEMAQKNLQIINARIAELSKIAVKEENNIEE